MSSQHSFSTTLTAAKSHWKLSPAEIDHLEKYYILRWSWAYFQGNYMLHGGDKIYHQGTPYIILPYNNKPLQAPANPTEQVWLSFRKPTLTPYGYVIVRTQDSFHRTRNDLF